ncbi:MAG: hypothetical protein COX90_01850 [Candidatus Nealsonbacteria bacterium CG_4_10_14_0_2_um_filter_38_17]|uniref:Peptidase C39 domain-containing protein n=2 Tax=Candidatus Nealsoniibacteriota TaxID=1817911 RepID=A0A2M7UYL7_9BACT|nr:MAG: hypothetical protein COX36_04470 [Candidatus Nealsonbacteria bacterium CG23_combo_of_CG06-09_8_20_14_all_38_19]PIZ88965.1 MAG: hypothetical protein COX90_01850 [Candidatus Nealsonbacteria bacterium CG_4_10_14_0_2_um_filter_38_17]
MDTRTNILPVKSFQETLYGGYCGPASLKMVLEYYGMDKSEKELAEMLKCDTKQGTNGKSIAEAAKKLGFEVEIKDNSSFEDIKIWLDKNIPVIVDWFSRGRYDYPEDDVADGHYSVVIGLDGEFIYLQDPEVGRIRKIKREDFLRVWFDFSTDYFEQSENQGSCRRQGSYFEQSENQGSCRRQGSYIKKCEDLILRQLIAIYR